MPRSIESLLALASDIEIMVYNWLVTHHIQFDFQSQLIGGYGRQLGDTVCDFVIYDPFPLVLRCQGEYWHSHTEEVARDTIIKAQLEFMGYAVVDLWEDDIRDRLDEVMRLALQGQEIPH